MRALVEHTEPAAHVEVARESRERAALKIAKCAMQGDNTLRTRSTDYAESGMQRRSGSCPRRCGLAATPIVLDPHNRAVVDWPIRMLRPDRLARLRVIEACVVRTPLTFHTHLPNRIFALVLSHRIQPAGSDSAGPAGRGHGPGNRLPAHPGQRPRLAGRYRG